MAGMDSIPPMPSESRRLFLALWPDADVRNGLQKRLNEWKWPSRAAPVPPASLHLTLHFLGAVPDVRLPQLLRGLQVPFSPFELRIGQATMWPHGIAVLEPDTVPDGLLQLHASLSAALQGLALPMEARLYRPHVTLARRAEGVLPPGPGPLLPWFVQDYALLESCAGVRGDYRILQRYT
jgi:2'-5' RNA ligase